MHQCGIIPCETSKGPSRCNSQGQAGSWKGHLGMPAVVGRRDFTFFPSTCFLAPSYSHKEEIADLTHQILGHTFAHICKWAGIICHKDQEPALVFFHFFPSVVLLGGCLSLLIYSTIPPKYPGQCIRSLYPVAGQWVVIFRVCSWPNGSEELQTSNSALPTFCICIN